MEGKTLKIRFDVENVADLDVLGSPSCMKYVSDSMKVQKVVEPLIRMNYNMTFESDTEYIEVTHDKKYHYTYWNKKVDDDTAVADGMNKYRKRWDEEAWMYIDIAKHAINIDLVMTVGEQAIPVSFWKK